MSARWLTEIEMLSNAEEQEKAAVELHAKLYGNPESKPDESAPPPIKKEDVPAPKANEPATEPVKQLKAKDPEKENDPAYWKRRAELLAGKFDAEVPRFAEENRQLKQKLAELEAKASSAPPAPADTTPVANGVIPEELKEKYGEEFLADMMKLLPKQTAPQTDGDVAVLKKELAEVKSMQAKSSFEVFKEQLATAAPQWEKLNTDEEFNDWLDGMDMASGVQRRVLFNDAVARTDVQRASHFFNAFGGNPVVSSTEEASSVPPAEHFMAPQHSKAHQPPPTKKFWTAGEIEAFYIDVRKGRVEEADAVRIEQDIFAAQREGRLKA
jgi:hypothetical protein